MKARSTGTAERRSRLNARDLLEIELDLPPLDEQTAIAEILGAADRVATAADAEVRSAQSLLRATRETLLHTDGAWTTLPDGWTTATLRDVSDVRSGITKGRHVSGELRPVPFIRAANVQDGRLDLTVLKTLAVTEVEAERFALQCGDVLMIEGGNAEHLGRGWLWDGDIAEAVFQNHVFRARPKTHLMRPEFLAHAIAAQPARDYCFECAKKTTNLASINKTQISQLPLPLPSLDEQDRILAALNVANRAVLAAGNADATGRNVHAAMLEELISGERRVAA